MHVEGRHVCAVCGRVLDHHEGKGWAHPLISGDPEMYDHPAVPVLDTEVPVRDRCDFCSQDETVLILPARSFVISGLSGSEGDWAACRECADLIEKDQWSALVRRVEATWQYKNGFPMPAEQSQAIRALYRKLRKNITGSMKPVPQ